MFCNSDCNRNYGYLHVIKRFEVDELDEIKKTSYLLPNECFPLVATVFAKFGLVNSSFLKLELALLPYYVNNITVFYLNWYDKPLGS